MSRQRSVDRKAHAQDVNSLEELGLVPDERSGKRTKFYARSVSEWVAARTALGLTDPATVHRSLLHSWCERSRGEFRVHLQIDHAITLDEDPDTRAEQAHRALLEAEATS